MDLLLVRYESSNTFSFFQNKIRFCPKSPIRNWHAKAGIPMQMHEVAAAGAILCSHADGVGDAFVGVYVYGQASQATQLLLVSGAMCSYRTMIRCTSSNNAAGRGRGRKKRPKPRNV